jgi:hypothetical protein
MATNDNQTLVLDISHVTDNLAEALVKARDAKQEAIYDLGKGQEINVADGLKQLSPEEISAAEQRVAEQKNLSAPGNTGKQSGLRGQVSSTNAGIGNAPPATGLGVTGVSRAARDQAGTPRAKGCRGEACTGGTA